VELGGSPFADGAVEGAVVGAAVGAAVGAGADDGAAIGEPMLAAPPVSVAVDGEFAMVLCGALAEPPALIWGSS
jgi:hypothetical protein